MTLLFALHFAATAFMAGLIWFVQILHYPLFGRIAAGDLNLEAVKQCHAFHLRYAGRVVGPPMIAELLTGAVLLGLEGWRTMFGAAFALLVLIWAVTFFVQVPLHQELGRQWLTAQHRMLVRTNWIRTIAWSARLLVLIASQSNPS